MSFMRGYTDMNKREEEGKNPYAYYCEYTVHV